MGEKKDSLRIPFNLYLENEEHQKVYEILQKQENRNAFIRRAILLYGDAISRDNGSLLKEFRTIMQEENREMFLRLMEYLSGYMESKDREQKSVERKLEKELDFEKIKKMF